MAEKHQIDIKELKKVYEDKIQLLCSQINGIEVENTRLRDIYEDALNKKIALKK